ncbi:MAG: M56 family metallopeptidase [Agathobaculum sp.]|jgi:beta-lactamase regulating signal transducer with metallopeptidase domain|uniref:M56 family metallopeptidase n=1 Tax=Agathobaculum sp. TaxID=2048138 RepID=UPI003D9379D0
MTITIFSFLSALLWSSLLIVAIYLLRHTRFKQHFGVLSMVMLYLFCAVRLFLPIELPYTLIAADSVIYPRIYSLLMQDFANRPLLILLCFLWLLGFCELLFRYVRQYRKAIYSVTHYAEPWDERTTALLEQVQGQTGRRIKVHGCTANHIESAFGIGVLRKYIMLPAGDYTEDELRYVLLHEYTHFLNHDTVVKLLVTLFCMVFWWNPVVYLLQKDLEQTLEIKCDLSVARMLNAKERAAYLRTILTLMKQPRSERHLPFAATALFRSDADAAIRERFETVMTYTAKPHNRAASAAFASVFAVLMIASYAVLPQPKFEAPSSTEPGAIDFDSSTAYIKQDHVGEYWLCIQNEQPIKLTEEDAVFYQQTGLKIMKE